MGEEEFSCSMTTSKTGHYMPATEEGDNKKQVEDCQRDEGRCWPDLLPEIMDAVAERCSISDLATLRATCTSWRTVGKRAHRSTSNYIGGPSWSLSPILITTEDEQCTFYNPLYDLHHTEVIPELIGAAIIGSMYGWLVLTRQSDPKSLFLFNVSTNIRIELPRYSPPPYFLHAWLSSPPNLPDCCIICMDDLPRELGIIRRGDDHWTYIDFQRSIMLACPPALCQGNLYCMDKKGRLAVFDPDNLQGFGEFAFERPLPMKRWKRHASFEQAFLVECDGELLAIFSSDHDGNKVSVFALDPSHGTWRTVRSLGDKLLFVSFGSSFVEKEIVKGTGNKIYMPKFTADGDYIVYDFAASAYRTLLADVRDLNSARGHCPFIKEVKSSSAWYQSACSTTCTEAFNW